MPNLPISLKFFGKKLSAILDPPCSIFFSNLLEEAVSFGDWFTPQLVRLNDENAQNSSLVTEHSSSDEERVIRFIRNHLKVDHVVQYFEQESLKNPYTKNSENNWKKLLEKHKVKSGIIYETESKVSLRTSLDYTRRLLTVNKKIIKKIEKIEIM